MNALRDDIYSTLESGNRTYTLTELANKYRTSEPVIEIQLQRLKDEGKKIKVSDEEVSIFLDHTHPIWTFGFLLIIGFIFAVCMSGLING